MLFDHANGQHHVIVVGGGFAGRGLRATARRRGRVRVTLIDRNGYHQFQPLLYQVATAAAGPRRHRVFACGSVFERARERRRASWTRSSRSTRRRTRSRSPTARPIERRRARARRRRAAELLPHARRGGARVPALQPDDAQRLRSRILQLFEDADRDPSSWTKGALNFVVVGGGPPGWRLAGALADLVHDMMPAEYPDLPRSPAPGSYSSTSGRAAGRRSPTRRTTTPPSSCSAAASSCGSGPASRRSPRTTSRSATARPSGRSSSSGAAARWRPRWPRAPGCRRGAAGGSTCARPDRRRALPASTRSATSRTSRRRDGDRCRSSAPSPSRPAPGPPQHPAPTWTAQPRTPFEYHDKGIMAMIGRNAAVAEVGAHRHELHGAIAFAAWLGVHA